MNIYFCNCQIFGKFWCHATLAISHCVWADRSCHVAFNLVIIKSKEWRWTVVLYIIYIHDCWFLRDRNVHIYMLYVCAPYVVMTFVTMVTYICWRVSRIFGVSVIKKVLYIPCSCTSRHVYCIHVYRYNWYWYICGNGCICNVYITGMHRLK